jgi:hypothetical protein
MEVALEYWSIPNGGEHTVTFLPNPLEEFDSDLHIAPIREDDCELIVRRLEDAEGRVHSAVDDLDVLHADVLTVAANVRNGSKADARELTFGLASFQPLPC